MTCRLISLISAPDEFRKSSPTPAHEGPPATLAQNWNVRDCPAVTGIRPERLRPPWAGADARRLGARMNVAGDDRGSGARPACEIAFEAAVRQQPAGLRLCGRRDEKRQRNQGRGIPRVLPGEGMCFHDGPASRVSARILCAGWKGPQAPPGSAVCLSSAERDRLVGFYCGRGRFFPLSCVSLR